jgi:hypothetical protein
MSASRPLAAKQPACSGRHASKRKLLLEHKRRWQFGNVPVVGVDDDAVEEAVGAGERAVEAEVGAEQRQAAAAGGRDPVVPDVHLVLLLLLLRHPPLRRPQCSQHRARSGRM